MGSLFLFRTVSGEDLHHIYQHQELTYLVCWKQQILSAEQSAHPASCGACGADPRRWGEHLNPS